MTKIYNYSIVMEELITEMIDVHELQRGEILQLVFANLQIHRPDAQEEYVEGGNPIFYYGPKKD